MKNSLQSICHKGRPATRHAGLNTAAPPAVVRREQDERPQNTEGASPRLAGLAGWGAGRLGCLRRAGTALTWVARVGEGSQQRRGGAEPRAIGLASFEEKRVPQFDAEAGL